MYIHIIVEVTMNMAEYGSRRSQQPENVNLEPIVRGLKNDNFDYWDQVLNPFHVRRGVRSWVQCGCTVLAKR